MSLSTTCTLFWPDAHGNVVAASNETAFCDNTYTQCQIVPKQPVPAGPARQLHATCDSRPHFPDGGYPASTSHSEYFCVCHGRAVSVPPGMTCTSSCTAFDCDTTGINCTEMNTGGGGGTGGLLYTCDNYEHYPQPGSSSTDAYVCNCHGAATIPSIYTSTGNDIQGKSCGIGTRGTRLDNVPPAAASTRSGAAASRDGDRAKTSSSRNFSIVTAVILLTRQWRRL